MISITGLFVYPVKSLKGISLNSVKTGLRGFEFDREWMITDSEYQFITQRQIEKMAIISVAIDSSTLTLSANGYKSLFINLNGKRDKMVNATVWDDRCEAYDEGENASNWLTKVLGKYGNKSLKLVRFSQNEVRPVPSEFLNQEEAQSAFSDQFPYLITSKESLDYLNENLKLKGCQEVTMDRFRANIVIKGLGEIEQKTNFDLTAKEDGYHFGLRKPCKRCKITTINQKTAEISEPKEPLATLTDLALSDEIKGAFFGQNAIYLSTENRTIKVGDCLTLNKAEK